MERNAVRPIRFVKYLVLTAFILPALSACRSPAPVFGSTPTNPVPNSSGALQLETSAAPSPSLPPSPFPTATIAAAHIPLASLTPTQASSSPASDLQVIRISPEQFLLKQEDLPMEGDYHLPDSSWTSPYPNQEILDDWGDEAGQDYIERTGRVAGWYAYYQRGAETAQLPEILYSNIVQYETAEGARCSVLEYNEAVAGPDEGWELLDQALELGDASVVLISRETDPDGEKRIWYMVEFAYRNFAVIVGGWGRVDDVQPEFIEQAARAVLARLEAAPLTTP